MLSSMLTEYVHSKVGIDIYSGITIGKEILLLEVIRLLIAMYS